MTASETPNRDRTSGRVALIVVGVCIGLLALAALASGALLVGIHATQRDGDGFYATGSNPLTTSTHALVSDRLDVRTDGTDWLFRKGRLGTIRVTATGTSAKPILIGIARTSDAEAYLRGVARDEITDLKVDPFSVTSTRRTGSATPLEPIGRSIWAKSSSGSGKQILTWSVRKGSWDVVVMNADGARGIHTNITVGAKLPALLWIGIGLLTIGGLLAAVAATVSYFGARRKRPEPTATPAGAPSAPLATEL
jgi:hypothetical protein